MKAETISAQEYRKRAAKPKASKYKNKRCVVDGLKFDSQKEAKRWGELKLLEKAGKISHLRRQVSYQLLAWSHEGAEPLGTYVADFAYAEPADMYLVVEDVKSKATKTPLYKLKKAIFEANYGIEIRES